ncbi:MAG: serine/threonine-protein kinase [Pseudomonadota bacterium]
MSATHIGPYQIVRPLARGGMGETLIARAPDGTLVVLKRLLEHLAEDLEAVRCFREEIRIAGRLAHTNIVRFIEVIEDAGQLVLVLEYVDGCSARDLVLDGRRRGEPIRVAEACAIVEGAARGLHFAHSLTDDAANPMGMIHRDVSLANLLISRSGEVKVIDFGVAKAWDAEGRTATGIVKGKVGYMSPEHTRCEPLDARSDVFSLGIVLWELLVCDRLFVADGPVATAYLVLESSIAKPSGRRPEIPARIDAICMHALERDLEKRTGSAQELARSLARWREETDAELDLGALVRQRFPVGLPEANDGAPTQVARGRAITHSSTDLVGSRAVAMPPPPPVPAMSLPIANELDNPDLSRTFFDQRISSSMRGVRQRSAVWRVILAVLAVAVIGAAVYVQWLAPPRRAGHDAAVAVFYSYQDSTGTQVIVGSLAQVPPERRPFAQRLDLGDAALHIEPGAGRDPAEIRRELSRLSRKLGAGSSSTAGSAREVLLGLAIPVGLMLLLAAVLFGLASRVRDGFVRWTLRLLVLFVLVVGMIRSFSDGILGRPGFRALQRETASLPVDRLAPALREVIRQMTTRPPPGTLGTVPPGVDLD